MANSIYIDALHAEQSSLLSLISELPPTDIVGRISLESRLKYIESQIIKNENKQQKTAETMLFLGGNAVNGSYGINVDLAADALKHYQALVSVVHASQRSKIIAETGPIPDTESSTMQLVATPRGSFGFVLKEKSDQLWITESNLYESVEFTNELIAASASESEEIFEDTLTNAQPRVLKELNNFLSVLNKYNASLRLVSSRTKIDIPKTKINLASSRTEHIEVTEKEIFLTGIFIGARKHSRDFNFQPDNESPISGKLGNEIEDKTVSLMNTTFQDKRCKAFFSIKETKRKESGRVSIRWILKDIFLEDTK